MGSLHHVAFQQPTPAGQARRGGGLYKCETPSKRGITTDNPRTLSRPFRGLCALRVAPQLSSKVRRDTSILSPCLLGTCSLHDTIYIPTAMRTHAVHTLRNMGLCFDHRCSGTLWQVGGKAQKGHAHELKNQSDLDDHVDCRLTPQ